MKKKTILSKKIIRELKNSDFSLNLEHLNRKKYFNYKVEEWYGEEFLIKGELKKRIIETLIRTYLDWKTELDKLNKEYYLAIWFYNPRMLKSEVVCAIDEKIHYYENDAFLSAKKKSKLEVNQFGKLSTELEKFNWDKRVDMDSIHQWELDLPKQNYESEKQYNKEQKFYKKMIDLNFHAVEKDNEKIYFYPKGDIWIGKLK
ncbi:hypothetical protein [Tenacibaculum geojense]|uniref:Uncharacterized protein n=1 Tax=Tenacibaculum geojense TaxID=915352 RepID=A0ABW3JMA9_9FLAO